MWQTNAVRLGLKLETQLRALRVEKIGGTLRALLCYGLVLRMQHGWKPILRTTSQSGRNRENPLTGLCLTGTGGKFNTGQNEGRDMSDFVVGRINFAEVPKGQQIPQTVENLQAIMARDAELIQEQAREIAALKVKVNQLQQKLKARSKPHEQHK
jgi:hypothetical protein